MEAFLPSSVGRSRNEAIDIELSPRLTHFFEEGLVPESPVLNINHHVPTVEKSRFLSNYLEDDKDTRYQTPIHVNKLSSDGVVSQSLVVLDALCENNSLIHFIAPPNIVGISGMSSNGANMHEKKGRVKNTINEAAHTPNTMKHSSSEDWKCNSGEASISFFQTPKYKRLRKHGDVVRKLPAKTLHKRFKLVEKACGSAMNTQHNKLNCIN